MLICIQNYSLVIRNRDSDPMAADRGASNASDGIGKIVGLELNSSKPIDLEVVLVIEELRVISFDRFQVKLPSSV